MGNQLNHIIVINIIETENKCVANESNCSHEITKNISKLNISKNAS